MKKLLLTSAFIMLFSGIFCFATTDDSVSISVLQNEMEITQNNVPTNLTTDNFVYNGTTYVPLRQISNLFGYDVEWSEDSPTHINLSNQASDDIKTVSLINLIATPERYHKQRVRVQGYCRLEFEADRLCFTDQTTYVLYTDYVPLELSCNSWEEYSKYYPYDGKLVDITGTFYYYPNENYNMIYLSDIEEIEICPTYEEAYEEYNAQAEALFGEGAYFDRRTHQYVSPNAADNELIYGENWRKIIGQDIEDSDQPSEK